MDPLRALLERNGLGKYAPLLAEHSVGLDVLGELTDTDLEKLGIPLGDRRRLLKAAAAPLVPDDLEAPQGREAERRQITVVFADLVDSTKLAGELDPEDMRDLIARYQTAVGDEVERFGGYVAKSLGDGLLIYFGWPRAHENDAERALRSAMAAVEAVRRLAAPNGRPLAVRLGIATGEVVVGDFTGAGVDETGAIIGGTPNLAARLQGVAAANAVVVAEETVKLVGRHFAFSDLGEQRLKGFDKPVRVWRADGERASESRFDAMRGSHLGRFVGREHEIGLLMQRWEDATDGECQLVLVSGEAGIGKSRLVAECLTRLAGRAQRVAYQGSPLHTNTALYPVVRYMQAKAAFAGGDGAEEKLRKLRAAVADGSERGELALLFLAELMSLESPGDGKGERRASANEMKEAAFEVLADALESEAAIAPLLIVVEDAHWLDATTQEFVERVLDRLQNRRVMVLVTYRPEFVPPWAQHANVGLLSLGRLGKRDARAIIESLQARGGTLSKELADDILAKSDGVPLFVEELTGSVLEAARASEDSQVQIPATLRDSLTERLDRLGSAKEVAQIASAYGREFSVDLVAATMNRSQDELQADIERLMAIDVVFESSRLGRRFTFRHALLQEAAYESMLKSRRREVHARIAEILSERRPEMAEIEPEVLATHLSRAGQALLAAESWRKAGHLALRNSAYREAIGAFNKALPLTPADQPKVRADIHRTIASAYFASGDYGSMREHLEQAAKDADTAGDQVVVAEIAMQKGHVLNMYGGDLAEAVRSGEQALAIAGRLNDQSLAYGARFCLGQTAWVAGDFRKAVRFLSPNVPEDSADPEGVRDFGTAGSLVLDSIATLGSILAHLGEFDRAFEILKRAERLVKTGAFNFSLVQYHLNRASLQRGDAAAARPRLVKAVAQAAEAGLRFTLPWHQALLGYAQVLLGEQAEGISLLETAFSATTAIHIPYTQALAGVFLAEALAPLDPARAMGVVEAARLVAGNGGFQAQEAELLRIAGAACLAGDPARAETFAAEGLALSRKLGMLPEQGHALRVLGDISRARGDGPGAEAHHAAAQSIYRQLGMAHWLPRAANSSVSAS